MDLEIVAVLVAEAVAGRGDFLRQDETRRHEKTPRDDGDTHIVDALLDVVGADALGVLLQTRASSRDAELDLMPGADVANQFQLQS